jgi:predicted transcriptional regulator
MTRAAAAGNRELPGVLMSIRSRHVRSIVAGTKTHELRRRIPRGAAGMRIFIYSSGEDRAVMAHAEVAAVDSGTPESIWSKYAHVLGVSRAEFDNYFAGVDVAYALHLGNVMRSRQPISLKELRSTYGLEPPQSWRYLTADICSRMATTAR